MIKEQLLQQCDTFLFDLDGTLWLSGTPFDDSIQTLNTLRQMGKKIVFVSNATGLLEKDGTKKLTDLGLFVKGDTLFTAAMVSIQYLIENCLNKRVQLLAADHICEEFVKAGGVLVEDNAEVCLIASGGNATGQTLGKFCENLHRGALFLAAQNDLNVPTNYGTLWPVCGSFVAFFQAATGREPDMFFGKPHAYLAEQIKRRLNVPFEKMCIVGDSLRSDIPFAINNGMHSVLLLTGETTAQMATTSPMQADVTLPHLKNLLN